MENKKGPFNLATKKSSMSMGREILVERFEWKPC